MYQRQFHYVSRCIRVHSSSLGTERNVADSGCVARAERRLWPRSMQNLVCLRFHAHFFAHSSKHCGVGLAVLCSADGSDFLQLAWTDAEDRPQHAVLLLNQQELLKMPKIVYHTDAGTDTSPAVNSVFVLEPNPLNAGMHKLGVMLRAGHSLRRGDSTTCTVGQGALLWDAVTRGLSCAQRRHRGSGTLQLLSAYYGAPSFSNCTFYKVVCVFFRCVHSLTSYGSRRYTSGCTVGSCFA